MPKKIHLDTNFLVYYVGGGDDGVIRSVDKWLRDGHTIYVSAMAWAEFQCGPLSDEENEMAAALINGVQPISKELADHAGELFRATGRRSRSLADCLIAAVAIGEQAFLATRNRADFEPFMVHGLKIM